MIVFIFGLTIQTSKTITFYYLGFLAIRFSERENEEEDIFFQSKLRYFVMSLKLSEAAVSWCTAACELQEREMRRLSTGFH